MNINDLVKRQRQLLNAEIAIAHRETTLAKKTMKSRFKHDAIQSMCRERQTKLEAGRNCLTDFQKTIAELRTLLENNEIKMEECKKQIVEFQELTQKAASQQIEQNQIGRDRKSLLRVLQEISKIYINLKTLPYYVQGMAIRQLEQGSEWVPFSIDPNELNIEDLRNMLWSFSERFSIYSQQWEHLICGEKS